MHNFKAGVARREHTDNSLESKGKKESFLALFLHFFLSWKFKKSWSSFFLISSSLLCFSLLPGHSSINAMGSPFPFFEFQKKSFSRSFRERERRALFLSFPFLLLFPGSG